MLDPQGPPNRPADDRDDPAADRAAPGPGDEAPPGPEAEALPAAIEAAPPPQAYTLPTARRVVATGLALALASTSELRRGSIYIGLLLLGAFGPAIIALLLIIGRLGDAAGDAFGSIFLGEGFGGPPIQPALEAALLLVAFNALLGLLLFVAISIDAQVIAIALLGGRAAERPLRLFEAIIRARQTFWRMAGSGTLVGVIGAIAQGLIVTAIDGFSRSPEASAVFGALIATVVVAPLAYVSTSVVLGDVGAMEALSRSWRLFRARRLLAVVVVLFTLVTSAIHLFAFGAGLDLVARAAELLQVSLTEGALAFVAATVLILSAVVAYGSLTFTIGAVVSAPQVAGFLGLTHFAGGLDRARVDAPKPPRGFHYVTRPMLIALVALSGIVALEIPAINSIAPVPTSGLLDLVESRASEESDEIFVGGYPAVLTDPIGDTGGTAPGLDLVQAEAAHLDFVPGWLLEQFTCGASNVACGAGASSGEAPGGGAILFLHRVAGAWTADGTTPEVAILLELANEIQANGRDGHPAFDGASRVFVARPGPGGAVTALRSSGFDLRAQETAARVAWSDTEIWTLVPLIELPHEIRGWDAVVLNATPDGRATGDAVRASPAAAMHYWDYPVIYVEDARAEPDLGPRPSG